jgi:uncharacterized protein (TIGR03000 family)
VANHAFVAHNNTIHANTFHANTFHGTTGAWAGRNFGWNGGWNGGWNRGWNGGWNRGWWGWRNGNNFWGGLFFGFPGLWGSPFWGAAYPYYDYYYPDYGYGYAIAPQAGYFSDFANDNVVPVPQVANLRAHIDVVVPDPNAVLMFNGYQTSSVGPTRQFDTPDLQPGTDYTYTIRAMWFQGGQPMSAERMVRVRAGSQAVVDFTQPPQQEPLPNFVQK